MARIRSVKPELRTSLTVADWPREVRYFWVLLWGYLDDHGYGVDEPRLIKADCFPLDDDITSADIDKWLDLMASPSGDDEQASVCRYAVNGKRYLHAPKWDDHQRPQHPKDSRIPQCPRADCGRASCGSHEDFTKPHEDFRNPRESLSGNGFSNTPSPTTSAKEGDGDVEGAGNRGTGGRSAGAPRPDVDRLCAHLADRVEANGSKRPAVTQKWRDAARLMLDTDKRAEENVHKAIDWCQDSEFWRSNVMSMPTLREQYDRLRLQAEEERNGGGSRSSPRRGPPPYQDPVDDSVYEEPI